MSNALTLNSNIASLGAQRRLEDNTARLAKSYTRLSSGLRINSASDDAAGLAMAASLNLEERVFNQGVRNINDAVSLLNIAESAAKELQNILIRQRELASEAANGTLGIYQRRALTEEACALSDEFNRIVASTEFNERTLLQPAAETLNIQAGFGDSGTISFMLATELARAAGTGALQAAQNYAVGNLPSGVSTADFDRDGDQDIAVGNINSDSVGILLNNGDGTFQAQQSINGINDAESPLPGDFDGDGIVDLAVAGWNNLYLLKGNGDGTFQGAVSYGGASVQPYMPLAADFDGNGSLDVALKGQGTLDIFLNNGNGTFQAPIALTPVNGDAGEIDLGDVNNDRIVDIVVANASAGTASVLLGNGDGSFAAGAPINLGNYMSDIKLADLNNDGSLDALAANAGDNEVCVFMGNGDGTFRELGALAATTVGAVTAADLNGDGYLDIGIVGDDADIFQTALGNGDGTFGTVFSAATGSSPSTRAFADFNGDGAVDAVTANWGSNNISVLLADTEQTSTIGRLNLTTRDAAVAAMSVIDDGLERVSRELGEIASVQSRMITAASNLTVTAGNIKEAASRILDADIAFEAAELVKNSILQQASVAVLGQANRQLELSLLLLQP